MGKKKARKLPKTKASAFRPGGVWRGLKAKIWDSLAIREGGSEQEPPQRRAKG
jgi:hypothetical protein